MNNSMPEVATCMYDENYLVYSTGDVYSSRNEKLKPHHTNGSGNPYLFYVFKGERINNKYRQKKVYIHRLVAQHFLENPDNLSDVHHIDNNPHNNDLSNLQWLSHADNCAKRPVPIPSEVIKQRPDAYIRYDKTSDRWCFRIDKPKHMNDKDWILPKKSFSRSYLTKEEAITCRNFYLAVA